LEDLEEEPTYEEEPIEEEELVEEDNYNRVRDNLQEP